MADTIKMSDGTVIVLRKLKAIDQARLLRAIGAEQSQNQPYVRMVEAAAAVESIDGVPNPVPRTEGQIDAMIQRVGDDALNTIIIKQMTEMKAAYDEIIAQQNAEAERLAAAAKSGGAETDERPLAQ